MKKQIYLLLNLFFFVLLIQSNISAQFGTWTALSNAAPNNSMGVMLLLTDGTVICKDDGGSGTFGTGWNRLTPDITGSYVNGTWTSIANMNDDRLFFPTQVLPNGKVFAAGGEYSSSNGSTSGEVYDPVANTWTLTNAVTGNQNIYDGNSEILATGVVLVGLQAGNNPGKDDLFYTNSTNDWTSAPQAPLSHDEAAWLKLPDQSILFVGIGSQNSCRYIPSTNTWVTDGHVPVDIYDNYGDESGPAFMLPNGKAIFFSASGQNALYTPSGTSSPGTWSQAASFPSISGTPVAQIDAAGAMMINGKILLAVSPVNTSNNDQFRSPFWFLEYDYTTNTFAQVTSIIPLIGADSVAGVPSNFSNMLDLPNGQVLFGVSEEGNNQYWVYTPAGSQIAQGIPTINSITETTCGVYRATGKLFNGISEGAGFGDDWQMETNYPIIRITNGTNVYYAKTTNWNRIGAVQTDSLEDTVQFTLPANVPAGTYSLVVTANGFASNPTLFSPYDGTASVLTDITCNGDNNGNATATVSGGNTPYTYKWSNGSSTVSTSNPTGTILSAGTYTLTVTDKTGCTSTSTVTITQPNVLTVTTRVTTSVSCNGGTNGAVSSTPAGGTSPYTYAWSGGGSTSAKTGLSAGTYTINITDKHGCTASATVSVTQPTTLTDTAQVTANVSCNGGNTGSASTTASGGTTPYTYTWSGGGTNSTKTGMSAGTYTITVKDKNGCTASETVTVTQPTALTATTHVTADVSCHGGNTGSALSTAAGGVSPYTYAWSGGGTNSTKTSMTAGTYTITIKDKNGCSATATAVITQPTALTFTEGTKSAFSSSNCDGSAWAIASGGTSPYTYLWSPSGGTKDTAKNLCTGSYCCTVTDKNGCVDSVCVNVKVATGIEEVSNSSTITIYPNPNNGTFFIESATALDNAVVEIDNLLGQTILKQMVSGQKNELNLNSQPSGVYFYRVLNESGGVSGIGKFVIQK
jgi:hypothetical protein